MGTRGQGIEVPLVHAFCFLLSAQSCRMDAPEVALDCWARMRIHDQLACAAEAITMGSPVQYGLFSYE